MGSVKRDGDGLGEEWREEFGAGGGYHSVTEVADEMGRVDGERDSRAGRKRMGGWKGEVTKLDGGVATGCARGKEIEEENTRRALGRGCG
ncbi:unnamed protein product [Calypogeia fissa]